MIRSSSSSLLNGILIFPLPFSEQVNCTLVLKKLESWLLQHIELFGQFGALGGYLAAAAFHGFSFAQGFHDFLYFAYGITLFEYLFKNLHLQFGVSQRYQCTGVPMSICLFCNPIWTGAGSFSGSR